MLSHSRLVCLCVAITTLLGVCCEPSPLALDLIFDHEAHERSQSQLFRRDSPLIANATNLNVLYYVDTALGTPRQPFRMLIATNTADLVFVANTAPACNNSACAYFGTFDANSSSSFKPQNKNFSITFADKSDNTGIIGNDAFVVGGQQFDDIEVLIGYNGTLNTPILGIGYLNLESTSDKYANLPIQLFSQKLTNIIGYSLFFNHSNATVGGRLIFGGVDTDKFYNTLETLPISMANLQYGYTSIQISNMSIWDGVNNHSVTNSNVSVSADSGTTGLYFPTAITQQIAQLINATFDGSYYCIALNVMNNDTTLDLLFGSTTIKIPLNDMVYEKNATHVFLLLFDASVSTVGGYIMGLPFFRNAYTVFDFSHNQISLAPLRHDSTINNVSMINPNGVAGLVGYVVDNGNSTPTGSSPNNTNTPTGGNSENKSGGGGLSTGAKAGIGVGVGVGVPLILGLIAFFILRNRRKNKNAAGPVAHEPKDQSSGYNRDSLGYKAELPTNANDADFVAEDGRHEHPSADMFAAVMAAGEGNTNSNGRVRRKPLPPSELPGSSPTMSSPSMGRFSDSETRTGTGS